ncbi:MAG TPA: DUF885 family protein, partial [Candidatus Polarisedimenticolia bacterium]|nr:DUF885 family protein [Candidatus Polarisedimenticolia bacterium]
MPSHPSKDDRQPIPRPGACPPADGRFYDLAERYLDGTMRLNPFIATYLGYHAYDPLLDDMTPQGLAEKLDFYRDARKTFAAVAPAGLSVGAAIDLDLIRTDIESNLFNLTELKPHENDPQTYNDIIGYGTLYLTILEDGSPQWPDRLDALLSRMRALPGFLAAAKSNLTTPAPVITQFIIDQNPGNLAFFEQALPPLFARYPALKAKFDREQPKVLAALREYQSFLETDLKRRSTGDWRLGRELWTRKLQLALQSDLSPEEIEARAWSALTATRQEMLQLALPLHEK